MIRHIQRLYKLVMCSIMSTIQKTGTGGMEAVGAQHRLVLSIK